MSATVFDSAIFQDAFGAPEMRAIFAERIRRKGRPA